MGGTKMTTKVSDQVQGKASVSPLIQHIAALLFGMIVLFAVGFAPMGVAHNVAHDARHTMAFPCH
jgi:cobalt transporter subunit CbtB